jgi:hypothetical protein
MNDSSILWKDKSADAKEFIRTYAVTKGTKVEKLDLPVIDETSIVKIVFKSSTGLKSKVKILNKDNTAVLESKKLYQVGSFSAIIDPKPKENLKDTTPENTKILIEYNINTKNLKPANSKCFRNKIIVSIMPYSEFIENSKCEVVKTITNLDEVQDSESVYDVNLGSDQMTINKNFLINKKLKVQFKPDFHTSSVQKDGYLMALINYDLAFASAIGKLNKILDSEKDFVKYGGIIAYEGGNSESALAKMGNVITTTLSNDYYETDSPFLEAEFSLSDAFLSQFGDDIYQDEL